MRKKHFNHHIFPELSALAVGVIFLGAILYLGNIGLNRPDQQLAERGDPLLRYSYEASLIREEEIYRRRQSTTTLLIMGIDRVGSMVVNGFRNGGQADFLRLVTIDHGRKTISQLQIDRDTMASITVLGILGDELGTRRAQICLSHGFGDGKAQSCMFTRDAVSRMLMDMPIDFYLAVNMDGISVLNDWVGGVTVTLEEDFSSLDTAMTKGTTLRLVGDQAEFYVRYRLGLGAGTNEARMTRQQRYISKLTQLLKEKITGNKNAIGALYDVMEPYLLTDMARGRIINEVWNARAYTVLPLLDPVGEYRIGKDGFMEFHPDSEQLNEIVLEMIYEKIN